MRATGIQVAVTQVQGASPDLRHHGATPTRDVMRVSVWQERASEIVVIALAAILLLPVLLTFMVLALFVARLFGVPLGGSAVPERERIQR
jgi:hypothetical protein